MTCSGGTFTASLIGQPPHLAVQYALSSPIRRTRASCSDALVRMTTLSGRASAITRFSSFPREQRSQYGFVMSCTPTDHALPGEGSMSALNGGACNPIFDYAARNRGEHFVKITASYSRYDEQPAVLPAGAVGPAGVAPPSPPAGPSHSPHRRNAALSDRASCSASVLFGAPQKRPRNLVRLPGSFGLTPSRPCQPLVATDLRPPLEAVEDHVAHLSSLKSAEPVRPVAVIHQ